MHKSHIPQGYLKKKIQPIFGYVTSECVDVNNNLKFINPKLWDKLSRVIYNADIISNSGPGKK